MRTECGVEESSRKTSYSKDEQQDEASETDGETNKRGEQRVFSAPKDGIQNETWPQLKNMLGVDILEPRFLFRL